MRYDHASGREIMICSKCQLDKQVFKKNSRQCKDCRRLWERERYANNPKIRAKQLEKNRKWRETHKDEAAEYQAKWAIANRDKVRAHNRNWKLAHRDEWNAYRRKWYAKRKVQQKTSFSDDATT
jgi:hypothetical protein